MDILLYITTGIVVGFILGLIGGGGTIITLPILVYLFGIEPTTAVSYTLLIIGSSSLVATVKNAIQKTINYQAVFLFAFPAFGIIYLIRKYLLPSLPDVLFTVGSTEVHKNQMTMILFAIVMLVASTSMIRGKRELPSFVPTKFNYGLVFGQGLLVGLITGLVGAGGGFLLIPALVFIAKLPIKNAISTSLLIITVNCFFGFLGDYKHIEFDWRLLGFFIAFSSLGVLVGSLVQGQINNNRLRRIFGWFVLLMGFFVLVSEFL